MPCGIYQILNNTSGKSYIGSSIDIPKRLGVHRSSLRGGYHCNQHLQNAWNKYGENVFDFIELEEVPEDLLDERERYWIDNSDTYNFSTPVGRNGHYHNKEFKRKQSSKPIIGITPTGDFLYFNTLWDAAEYVIQKGYAKGKHRNVRMEISNTARGVRVNNGSPKGSIRSTAYKHQWSFV